MRPKRKSCFSFRKCFMKACYSQSLNIKWRKAKTARADTNGEKWQEQSLTRPLLLISLLFKNETKAMAIK